MDNNILDSQSGGDKSGRTISDSRALNDYITKDGKRLRRGYTTGSCAAAAAKAAAIMLLGGEKLEAVTLITPSGIELTLDVVDISIDKLSGANDVKNSRAVGVSCGIVKDGGDDPDVTSGITIYARVERIACRDIIIDGGVGIGRVTKPGLDQPVGAAAINSTPRRMIRNELIQVIEDYGYTDRLRVTISAPDGVETAKKTFNPRLGIVGGISILGTTGIVEPMSDDALRETIRAELSMRSASGHRYVLFVPGNYGSDFIKNSLGIDPEIAVTTSNFIGDAFAMAAELGFSGALLVGHIGKLVKLAGGMFNTHSRWGDCRAEIFASHSALRGASREVVAKIMDSVTTDDMLSILDGAGLRQDVTESIVRRIDTQLSARQLGGMRVGAIIFSNIYGLLGSTSDAEYLLCKIKGEYNK